MQPRPHRRRHLRSRAALGAGPEADSDTHPTPTRNPEGIPAWGGCGLLLLLGSPRRVAEFWKAQGPKSNNDWNIGAQRGTVFLLRTHSNSTVSALLPLTPRVGNLGPTLSVSSFPGGMGSLCRYPAVQLWKQS